jgi:hypothetical protein
MILGKPFIMYLGIVVFALFVAVAVIGMLILKGKAIPIIWHKAIAGTAIVLGLIHAIIGAGTFF